VNNPSYQAILTELDEKVGKWMEKLNDPFDSSMQVADKYSPGHIRGVTPYYQNALITKILAKRRIKQARKGLKNKIVGWFKHSLRLSK